MMDHQPTPAGALPHVLSDIDRVLIDRRRIEQRVHELGAQIRKDLESITDHDEITLVPILTGSIIFVADLIRHLPQRMRIDVVTASSYAGRTTSSSGDPLLGNLPADLSGRWVLIVDDILDSGTTIRRVRKAVASLAPASLRVCVLLRKQIPPALETPAEYVGFDIPDEFVVGYGLDYNGLYRNFPDIGVLKQKAL
ncbi:MAG: hypoxanthine phosphoribosyltransferase [Planctomycetes bacterium]|nr:hypoxanthine phosphoribosyltransferase [Planctomycetota bacterium]